MNEHGLPDEQGEGYEQFLAECAKHCRCTYTLCDSVLCGAPCEERIEATDEFDEYNS